MSEGCQAEGPAEGGKGWGGPKILDLSGKGCKVRLKRGSRLGLGKGLGSGQGKTKREEE